MPASCSTTGREGSPLPERRVRITQRSSTPASCTTRRRNSRRHGRTVALVSGAELPGPETIGVDDAAYLNGLAETVGELRRHTLDVLRKGDLERCEELLGAMEDIYAVLVTVDYPDGVTAGLRRSTDVARSIIERTRGDLATAAVQAQLRAALDAHRAVLES